jgi:hypothetical protein
MDARQRESAYATLTAPRDWPETQGVGALARFASALHTDRFILAQFRTPGREDRSYRLGTD